MTSKFAAVLAAKNGAQNEETGKEPSAPQKPVKNDSAAKERTAVATEPRRVGRPNAKRSDPDYVQTTAYIKKTTHRDVKIAQLASGDERDFSELVEDLLSNWLKSNR